jgi:S-adenosylmethionine decarboxylase
MPIAAHETPPQAASQAVLPNSAGIHLLIDLWGAEGLDDLAAVRAAMLAAIDACGARLVDLRMHDFAPTHGITAVALLAESHMSFHSWPERGYAALDVFVCGPCDPYRVLPVLREAFRPRELVVSEQRRGIAPR